MVCGSEVAIRSQTWDVDYGVEDEVQCCSIVRSHDLEASESDVFEV